jgi:hypothetical protein
MPIACAEATTPAQSVGVEGAGFRAVTISRPPATSLPQESRGETDSRLRTAVNDGESEVDRW